MKSQRRPKETTLVTNQPDKTTDKTTAGNALPVPPTPRRPNLGSTYSLRSGRGNEEGDVGNEEGQGDWLAPRTLSKPSDQLQLSDKELSEEFTRILSANNPHAPQNIARFIHRERVYKASPNVDHLVCHFELNGHYIYKGGDDGGLRSIAAEKKESDTSNGPSDGATNTETEPAGDEEEKAPPIALLSGTGASGVAAEPKARNHFNSSDRASQTLNAMHRERGTNTNPPPQKTFSDTSNQWTIYDWYIEDMANKERLAKEKAKGGATGTGGGKTEGGSKEGAGEGSSGNANAGSGSGASESNSGKGASTHGSSRGAVLPPVELAEDVFAGVAMARSAKILERMTNQNTFDDVAEDFKYWEDASDEFKEGKGTLLPLWKFVHDKSKKKAVTALAWSPTYQDMFAVGYGSFDFLYKGPGVWCCFSFKNPSYPEYIFHTESGVLSLQFHPKRTNLVAVGLYDGTVMVYNLRKKSRTPMYRSSTRHGKHADPVWQVHWQPDDLDDNANFYSVSSDGRITQWTLVQNELVYTDVLILSPTITDALIESSGNGIDDTTLSQVVNGGLAGATVPTEGGSCFDFHPSVEHLFIVGTEEGIIHKCSKAYNSKYLRTFEGHQMGVYAVRYNRHHPSIFLSASADWTVKMWDHDDPSLAAKGPILSFDMGAPVGDVAWAPFSPTIFAAVTVDGKVVVYDLAVDKHEPICEQHVVRKGRMTRLIFNATSPVLIAGDDLGGVVSLKLSPNLRKKSPNEDALLRVIQIAKGIPDER